MIIGDRVRCIRKVENNYVTFWFKGDISHIERISETFIHIYHKRENNSKIFKRGYESKSFRNFNEYWELYTIVKERKDN